MRFVQELWRLAPIVGLRSRTKLFDPFSVLLRSTRSTYSNKSYTPSPSGIAFGQGNFQSALGHFNRHSTLIKRFRLNGITVYHSPSSCHRRTPQLMMIPTAAPSLGCGSVSGSCSRQGRSPLMIQTAAPPLGYGTVSGCSSSSPFHPAAHGNGHLRLRAGTR